MFPKKPGPKIERVKFALRATGVDPSKTNPLRSGTHTRGYLPHVKREGASYFVTFRLADSLPKEVLLKFQEEHAERLHRLLAKQDGGVATSPTTHPGDSEEEIDRDYYRKLNATSIKAREPATSGILKSGRWLQMLSGISTNSDMSWVIGWSCPTCSCCNLADAQSSFERDYEKLERLHRAGREQDSQPERCRVLAAGIL